MARVRSRERARREEWYSSIVVLKVGRVDSERNWFGPWRLRCRGEVSEGVVGWASGCSGSSGPKSIWSLEK